MGIVATRTTEIHAAIALGRVALLERSPFQAWIGSRLKLSGKSRVNSLFNRENTGNIFNFEGLYLQNLPDLPAFKGSHGFHPKIRTGNYQGNRKI